MQTRKRIGTDIFNRGTESGKSGLNNTLDPERIVLRYFRHHQPIVTGMHKHGVVR